MENCGKFIFVITFIGLFMLWCIGFISIIKFIVNRRNTWYEYKGTKYRLIHYDGNFPIMVVEDDKGNRVTLSKKELAEFVPTKRK